jgi:hypothetical protein
MQFGRLYQAALAYCERLTDYDLRDFRPCTRRLPSIYHRSRSQRSQRQ